MIQAIIFDFIGVLYKPGSYGYEGELNEELIDYCTTLTSDVELFIFTSDNHFTPESVKILQPIFKHIFIAKNLNIRKSDPETYNKLAIEIGHKPENILFFDDIERNIIAAQDAGLNAYHVRDSSDAIRVINSSL